MFTFIAAAARRLTAIDPSEPSYKEDDDDDSVSGASSTKAHLTCAASTWLLWVIWRSVGGGCGKNGLGGESSASCPAAGMVMERGAIIRGRPAKRGLVTEPAQLKLTERTTSVMSSCARNRCRLRESGADS